MSESPRQTSIEHPGSLSSSNVEAFAGATARAVFWKSAGRARTRVVRWYEHSRRPGLILAGVIFLLYGRTLGWGFVLDDERHLRVMEAYRDGDRDSLSLYRFLVSDEFNRQARERGWYPWWLAEDVRYEHWRPVSEWLLYGQYLLFGQGAWGYHLLNVLIYGAGVLLVLRLFGRICEDQRMARWGALVFALMAGHGIPVTFISAQSDLIALALVTGAMLASVAFIAEGGKRWVLVSSVLYGISLGVKESCLPAAVLPALLALPDWKRPGIARRAVASSGLLIGLGLIWFGFYLSGGFGSNSSMMLDPVAAPLAYLSALPGRALALLSSLVIPVNPFLFYLRPRGIPWLIAYCAVGGLLLVWAVLILRRARHRRGVVPMALWVLPFLPLLACTVPDDRVMLLPGIGFAFLVGVWMVRARLEGAARLAAVLFVFFVPVHGLFAMVSSQVLRFVELDRRACFADAVQGFGRSVAPGDFAFFVNNRRDWQVLFAQMTFERVVGRRDSHVAFLTDGADPSVTRVDERTLRIKAGREKLFEGFLGKMAVSRDRPRRVGDVFSAGELVGRILSVSGETVEEVELEFRKPLDHPSYRFYWCDPRGRPEPWQPPLLQARRSSG